VEARWALYTRFKFWTVSGSSVRNSIFLVVQRCLATGHKWSCIVLKNY
jgi:hypothetical protein